MRHDLAGSKPTCPSAQLHHLVHHRRLAHPTVHQSQPMNVCTRSMWLMWGPGIGSVIAAGSTECMMHHLSAVAACGWQALSLAALFNTCPFLQGVACRLCSGCISQHLHGELFIVARWHLANWVCSLALAASSVCCRRVWFAVLPWLHAASPSCCCRVCCAGCVVQSCSDCQPQCMLRHLSVQQC